MLLERIDQRNLWIKRLKHLGVFGFLFFFLKGMLWIVVPVLLLWVSGN